MTGPTGFTAPVDEVLFTLRHVAGLDRLLEDGLFPGLDLALTGDLLGQAGRFADGVLAPLNQVGDRHGVQYVDGQVVAAPGFADAYHQWAEAGWNGVAAPVELGGSGLPVMLNTAVMDMHTAACMAFGLGPVLTQGAVDALAAHADPALVERYLPRLVSGEWTATMNLTEPQAGSDLALLRTRAEPVDDGSYRLHGSKIFITCGDHDMAPNILHLVLARLPDAPAGTRGISLFLVPKFLLDAEGNPGVANDLRCVGIEHKLGLHASPTCSMEFGGSGGAVGWLIGQPHRGLACMFTMMNRARLATGLQGVSIGERAYQRAVNFARERMQGRVGADPRTRAIIDHPDVRRMLLTMRALTGAARAIAYVTAATIDRAEHGGDAGAQALADLLTPVAKSFCSEAGIEVASLGIQVHGGMGFVEETGAAQHLRDVRITSIYEGTNGIQAIDLVTRKLSRDDGATLRGLITEWRAIANTLGDDVGQFGEAGTRLMDAISALEVATDWLLAAGRSEIDRLAACSPYLRLLGLVAGGAWLARGGLAAAGLAGSGNGDPAMAGRIASARFYGEHLVVSAGALAQSVMTPAAAMDPAVDAADQSPFA